MIFRVYNRVMNKHPIKTQCITTAFLISCGDIIAQKVIEKRKNFNKTRTFKFALFGLFYVGPLIPLWYRFLDRRFGRTKQIQLKPWHKVIFDQIIFSPLINLFALPILGWLNKKSYIEIEESIRKNYLDIMKANYKIWPAVQIVNFYMIPLNYRSVFVSFFSLAWNSYYAWKLGEK